METFKSPEDLLNGFKTKFVDEDDLPLYSKKDVIKFMNDFTNQTPRQLKEELECAVILLQMDIDSLELSNMDFYNKYGFNVAERMDKTRLFLTSIENKRK